MFEVFLPINVNLTGNGKEEWLPLQSTKNAAGYDLFAAILNDEEMLYPGYVAKVPTGLILEIPPGYEMQIRPRSGLAFKDQIIVVNSPGTIDSDYRGEVCVLLGNLGRQPFRIKKGMRIAQGVFSKVEQVHFTIIDNLSKTERGEGGFGHSGV